LTEGSTVTAQPPHASLPREPHPPHPPLTRYYADESRRARWVRAIFDATAVDYDRIEHLMAFGTGPWYRRQALARAGLGRGMDVLDVGTGTGLTALAAIDLVGDARRVTGVDPSAGMLAASKVPPDSPRLLGAAESLPVPDACADFVTMGFALRHVSDLDAVFAEFFRAVRPGGRVCLLEITRPEGRMLRASLKLYLRGFVPLLARLAGRAPDMPRLMRYYWDTIEACVPPQEVMARLRSAGFTGVERHVEAGLFSEYRAVRPALH
jgi:demethylmenaquinone methyltransferase/2-methoxy-6-polyprenyl-1,4-benzoquinol methylase